MISGLIHVARSSDPVAIECLADTLSALVAGVAAGLVGDAVIVTADSCSALETMAEGSGATLVEVGRITLWEPPRRFSFEWRARNFEPTETTNVDVAFEPMGEGTDVVVVHSGFSKLRPDHPVRHGYDDARFLRSMGLWWGELLTSLRERVE